jgi:NAD(P)H-nitrite reductase large subunit
VRSLHGAQGRVATVELDDGTRIDGDLVVLGIGVLPNAELAQQAGIAVDNGIVVDMLGRTSAPQVLAAGDVASMALPPAPGMPARMRLESLRQGTLVAAHSVNKPAEHMHSRKLIGARARPGADQLADPSFDLKTVA